MKRKLVNKKRFYTFMAIVIMTIALICAFINDKKPEIVGYDTYYAQNGDTLWSVAEKSNGWDYVPTDELVHELKKASNISSNINIGDMIKVPMYNINVKNNKEEVSI